MPWGRPDRPRVPDRCGPWPATVRVLKRYRALPACGSCPRSGPDRARPTAIQVHLAKPVPDREQQWRLPMPVRHPPNPRQSPQADHLLATAIGRRPKHLGRRQARGVRAQADSRNPARAGPWPWPTAPSAKHANGPSRFDSRRHGNRAGRGQKGCQRAQTSRRAYLRLRRVGSSHRQVLGRLPVPESPRSCI